MLLIATVFCIYYTLVFRIQCYQLESKIQSLVIFLLELDKIVNSRQEKNKVLLWKITVFVNLFMVIDTLLSLAANFCTTELEYAL